MFRRREKGSTWHAVRRWIVPPKGHLRNLRYTGYRLIRLPGTPHSVAAGFAFGVAVSFTPLIGLHMLAAVGLAWLFRSNIAASMIGTAVGNPWTFPMIWTGIYHLGAGILGRRLTPLPSDPALADLIGAAGEVWVPMMIGGVVAGTVVWLAFYYPGRYLVALYQERRRRRRAGPEVSSD